MAKLSASSGTEEWRRSPSGGCLRSDGLLVLWVVREWPLFSPEFSSPAGFCDLFDAGCSSIGEKQATPLRKSTLANITGQQWCRFILSIRGDNLQCYSNFALFSTLGGMKLVHYFFTSANQVKTKKKVFTKNWIVFVPKIKRRPKIKKIFTENWRVFFPEVKWWPKKVPKTIQRSDADHSQIIGGDAGAYHNQMIGGGAVKLLGDISPRVSAPLLARNWSGVTSERRSKF